MTADYRPLTLEDYEQAAHLEAVAFYNRPTPERVDLMRRYFPPEWTVGAFVDGRLVADARAIPTARHINRAQLPFACVGPVACLAAYRRLGHVGKLLRLALERMRERGQALSGLYTPHDALYARYGWERSEGKKRYEFYPNEVQMRLSGAPGKLEQVAPDGWERLDAVYREYAGPRNGPLVRVEPWWREAVLRHWEDSGERWDNDSFVWVSPEGRDEGYIIYHVRPDGLNERGFQAWRLRVGDFVALSSDAYLAMWRHLLAHDLTVRVVAEVSGDDPFPDLTSDPLRVRVTKAEGAMLRVVDVERAIALRPYCGEEGVAFSMRIHDAAAPWNEGTWAVEALDGRMQAKRTDAPADVEMEVNFLAPLFTGHVRPDVAAATGMLRVIRAGALPQMAAAFAVTHPPYCNDSY